MYYSVSINDFDANIIKKNEIAKKHQEITKKTINIWKIQIMFVSLQCRKEVPIASH